MAEGKDAGGFRYDSSTSGNGPTTSRKRRLIRGVGLPLGSGIKPGPGIQGGGGATLTVSPHRTITNQVSQTFELPGGGRRLSSPGVWTECTQRTIKKDIQIQEQMMISIDNHQYRRLEELRMKSRRRGLCRRLLHTCWCRQVTDLSGVLGRWLWFGSKRPLWKMLQN